MGVQRQRVACGCVFSDWLKVQKECLEPGYYKTNVLKPIAMALAGTICTKNTPVPSPHSIEKLVHATEIPYKTREELDKHLTRCLKLLFKYPVKGVPPAKRTPKDGGPDGAKGKPKPRGK